MKKAFLLQSVLFISAVGSSATAQNAQIPQKLNHQGRVAVQGTNFNGTGQFKFALVDGGYNSNQTATAIGAYSDGNTIIMISIQNAGYGYTTAPVVTISAPDVPGGGGGAAAVVVVVVVDSHPFKLQPLRI